ncbi:DUF4255 domain-containing protein [Streptomyces sp. 8N616]|uniref:DUF4255 domain-containing protein n=1 Tax=Streptomyces sp. 8N616 TaxID=3457414 RepID=UPI003FD05E7B
MSNALAIAHVTQALALLIENNLQPEIDIAVSVETRKPYADPPTEPTITVFLYQVTPNPSMRNNDLVTRAPDGTLLKRPAAALDLHYVISAYGEETELVGQRLIGSVVRTLHEIPMLPKDVMETAAERPYLAGSDLAESVQKVRFTPAVMDVDETSKLWGMLHQTPYSLSVVYQASLVLIEGREKPVPAKPVETRTVRVLPFGAPGAPEPPVTGGGDGVAAPVGGPAGSSKPAETRAAGSAAATRGSSARGAAAGTATSRGRSASPRAGGSASVAAAEDTAAPADTDGRPAGGAAAGGLRTAADGGSTEDAASPAPAAGQSRRGGAAAGSGGDAPATTGRTAKKAASKSAAKPAAAPARTRKASGTPSRRGGRSGGAPADSTGGVEGVEGKES